MGTNYYISCVLCGTTLKHIGKQYNGKFESNITREEFMQMPVLEHQSIQDEQGNNYTKIEFLEKVAQNWHLHQNGKEYFDNPDMWC